MDVRSSNGYLIFDPKKCVGCYSCMLACTQAHEGKAGLTLSRIQIINDPLRPYPTDIEIGVCHQCDNPECYSACPSKGEALYIDEKTGVRCINEDMCTGCQLCIEACIFRPSMITFDAEKNVSIKCDLCQNTPYWNGKGKQACVEVCPTKAIQFTNAKPVGYEGYRVNLRGEGWQKLGFHTEKTTQTKKNGS